RGTGRPGMPYPGRPGMPPGPGSYYRPGGPGAPGSAVPPVRTLPSGAPGPGQLPYAPPSESHYRRPDGVPFASGVNNGMAGRFAANNIIDDIQILAHDITVEQGKTYRYALSYKLVNPLFGFFDNNAPPAAPNLMNTFALASPPVEAKNEKVWGKPVAVEPRTKLWVTNVNVYGGKATFDVFMWTDGRYHQQTVKDISPGDPIGPSLWTVVDVRNDLRSKADSYVIVMDPKGNLFRRDAVSDKANPEHEKLKALATAAAAAR
ncbi:MAG: hypothetical protein JWO87_4056, partial [Phycisphaerales bacterium]|nr:hypothetical protein [Phycisphaerales bacterium]